MPKILYVEDTENFRILVMLHLEREGYDVVTAEDATSGIAMAKSEKPDLILMDMGLPEMDGWQATRILKADPATKEIPVIAVTAHTMTGDREKTLEAGCDEYDTKPFEFPRLMQKIRTLINARKPAS
jgi:two-component system, cell cycle response regulator DivK